MSLRADIPDQYLDIAGLRIRYIEKGEGRPLLMLHGMGYSLSADQFLPHIDAFSAFSHVYALDLPGWGISEAAKEGPYFPLWVSIVRGFADQLGLQEMDVFGYSIGGWVSTLFAADNPDRVRRLILLDAPGMNLEAPNFVANFQPPTRESLKNDMVQHMREMVTDAMVDEVFARLNAPGHEDAYRQVAAYVADPEVRKANSLHSVFPRLPMPVLLSQMDNAGTVLIRYLFEAYQLAPNPRMFIYYGGSRRTVGGIDPQVERTAIEFLTADEVPPPGRK
jgi:pimeloyl-ACP methyl ester carboxylesterase